MRLWRDSARDGERLTILPCLRKFERVNTNHLEEQDSRLPSHKYLARLSPYLPLLYVVALLGLVGFQAYAYYRSLPLSLGPFVILMPAAMRQGYLPYEQLFDIHEPLLPLLISFFAVPSIDGLFLARIFLVVLVTLATLLTFWAGKRQAGWLGGLATVAFFVWWSVPFGLPKLWHESLLTSLYVLLFMVFPSSTARRSIPRLVILGLLGGVAMLTKQHAVFGVGAMLGWQAVTYRRARRPWSLMLGDVGLVAAFALLPLIVYGIYYILIGGAVENWIYWTVTYNLTSNFVSMAGLLPTSEQILGILPAYLLVPAAILYAVQLRRKGDTNWERFAWALLLLVVSSLTAFPRFEFFHLSPSLPLLAWLSAITLVQGLHINRTQDRSSIANVPWVAGITLAVIALPVYRMAVNYQTALGLDAPRKIWEYSDLVPLTAEIRQHIGPTDCVYIFPDDEATSNLYYLLSCPPPKFWILDYPWDMTELIQKRILSTLETSPPAWIIYPMGRSSIETFAPEIVSYIQANYQFEAQLNWAQGPVQLLKRK